MDKIVHVDLINLLLDQHRRLDNPNLTTEEISNAVELYRIYRRELLDRLYKANPAFLV